MSNNEKDEFVHILLELGPTTTTEDDKNIFTRSDSVLVNEITQETHVGAVGSAATPLSSSAAAAAAQVNQPDVSGSFFSNTLKEAPAHDDLDEDGIFSEEALDDTPKKSIYEEDDYDTDYAPPVKKRVKNSTPRRVPSPLRYVPPDVEAPAIWPPPQRDLLFYEEHKSNPKNIVRDYDPDDWMGSDSGKETTMIMHLPASNNPMQWSDQHSDGNQSMHMSDPHVPLPPPRRRDVFQDR